jgi:hypothetical protein
MVIGKDLNDVTLSATPHVGRNLMAVSVYVTTG